jgi:hypothetical protein
MEETVVGEKGGNDKATTLVLNGAPQEVGFPSMRAVMWATK